MIFLQPDVPRVPLEVWVEGEAPPVDVLTAVRERAAERWPRRKIGAWFRDRRRGDDPTPEVDASFDVIEVDYEKRVVAAVTDPEREVAHADLPSFIRINRRIGEPWWQTIAYVLVRRA